MGQQQHEFERKPLVWVKDTSAKASPDENDMLEVCSNTLNLIQERSVRMVSVFQDRADSFLDEMFGNNDVQDNNNEPTEVIKTNENVVLWLWTPKDDSNVFVLTLNEAYLSDEKHKPLRMQSLILAMLLSSKVIYNAIGPIDTTAIDKMNWLVDLPNYVKFHPNQDAETVGDCLSKILPPFTYMCRDLKSKWLESGSLKTYFNSAFEQEPGIEDASLQRNQIRDLFAHYFPTRECISLPPVANKDYQNQLPKITRKIVASAAEPAIYGSNITASLWTLVLEHYLETLNAGEVPCVQLAKQLLVREQSERTLQEAVESYETDFQLSSILSTQDVLRLHFRALERASMIIDEKNLTQTYRKMFQDQVETCYQSRLGENRSKSKDMCESLVESCFPALTTTIETSQDLLRFQAEWSSALAQYELKASGPYAVSVLAAKVEEMLSCIEIWGKNLIRGLHQEIEQLDQELEEHNERLAGLQVSNTSEEMIQEQKNLFELSLKEASESLASEKQRAYTELEDKKMELQRVMSLMTRIQQDHDEICAHQRELIESKRKKATDLEQRVVTERDRTEEDVGGVHRELIASERGFHKEERNLLEEQKQLMAKVIELERKLGENKTIHLQKTFQLSQEAQTQYQELKQQFDQEMNALKLQSKTDLATLRKTHENQVNELQDEIESTRQVIRDSKQKVLKHHSSGPLSEKESELCRTS